MTENDSQHLAPELAALLAEYQPSYTTPSFAQQVGDPSRGQRRHCYLALEVVEQALQRMPLNPVSAVPAAIETTPGAKQRMATPRVRMYAYEVLRSLPARARLASSEAARRQLSGADAATVSLLSHPGVFVQTAGAVFATEVHPATRVGGTSDPWMRRRVAAHAVLGSLIPGYAGTLIFTPRWTAAGLHVPVTGIRHPLGHCLACRAFAPQPADAETAVA